MLNEFVCRIYLPVCGACVFVSHMFIILVRDFNVVICDVTSQTCGWNDWKRHIFVHHWVKHSKGMNKTNTCYWGEAVKKRPTPFTLAIDVLKMCSLKNKTVQLPNQITTYCIRKGQIKGESVSRSVSQEVKATGMIQILMLEYLQSFAVVIF